MNLCSAVLVGHLAADPEFTQGKQEPDENGVRSDDRAYTRIAVNRINKKDVDYFNIQAVGKTAHVLLNHTEKGKHVSLLCIPRSWRKQKTDGTWENNVSFTITQISLGESSKKVRQKELTEEELIAAVTAKVKETIKRKLEQNKIEASAEDPFNS